MPQSGSQVVLCDIPIRFDTYRGCSHGCKYCFAAKKCDIAQIGLGETPKSLKNFIAGKRSGDTRWCDWDIPLHWGGLSDPFQPAEAKHRNSYKCLEVFAETKYPFVFSTKGKICAEPEYLDLISKCNCAAQISLIAADEIKKFEPGAPSFDERLEVIRKLAPDVKRLLVRIQPYMPQYKQAILEQLKTYKNLGVYGVIVEGLKLSKKKAPCTEKVGGDYCLPLKTLKNDFFQIKHKCHDLELKFFSGENRLRNRGDSLCCCGVDGIPGWKVNKANLNHIYFKGDCEFTDNMKRKNTGAPFKCLRQTTLEGGKLSSNSFAENMTAYAKDSYGRQIYGINDSPMCGRVSA